MFVVRHNNEQFRFTPTGVGTIIRVALRVVPVAVHPHGRGDNEREE